MYGPTVVITPLVDPASRRIESGSPVSASINSRLTLAGSIVSRWVLVCSSLVRLRPASAQRVSGLCGVGGARWARYSAVRPPVKPVAPNTTTSYFRSAIGPIGQLLGEAQRPLGFDPGAGHEPTRDRCGLALGGVRGDPGERQQRLELGAGRRRGPQLGGICLEPLFGVHRRASVSGSRAPRTIGAWQDARRKANRKAAMGILDDKVGIVTGSGPGAR